jgi:hypothetical protein
MSDAWFAILFAIVLLILAGIGVVLLLWPSSFLLHVQNPLQPDTPINRVNMRAMGVFFCLFVLLPLSGSMKTSEGFQRHLASTRGFASHPAHIPLDSLAVFSAPTGKSTLSCGRTGRGSMGASDERCSVYCSS